MVLDNPRGMAVVDGELWVADVDVVRRLDLRSKALVGEVEGGSQELARCVEEKVRVGLARYLERIFAEEDGGTRREVVIDADASASVSVAP